MDSSKSPESKLQEPHEAIFVAAPCLEGGGAPSSVAVETSDWHRPFARIVATQFVFGLGFSVLSIVPTMLVRQFQAGPREVGLATATLAGGCVLLAPVAGIALDRFGRVPLLRLGIVVASLAVALLGLTLHLPFARTPCLFLAGAAFVIVFNGTSTLVADVAPSTHLARAMGWQGAANMVAHALAPTVAEVAAPRIGWPTVFVIASIIILASGLLAASIEGGRPASRAQVLSIAGARRDLRALGPFLAAAVCAGAVYGAIFSFQQPFMIEKGAKVVRDYFFGFTAGALIMRVGFGSLPDRVGHARTARVSLLAYGLVSLAFVVVGPSTLGFGGFAHGVAHGVMYPALVALAFRSVSSDARGLAASLTNGAFHAGHAGASVGLGALAARFGTVWVFVAGAVIACASLVFVRDAREAAEAPEPSDA